MGPHVKICSVFQRGMKRVNPLIGILAVVALSACSQNPLPEVGDLGEPLHIVDPTVYDVEAELPYAEEMPKTTGGGAVSPQVIIAYEIRTFITSATPSRRGWAFVGELINDTSQPAQRSKQISIRAVYSVSGGFDAGKIKATIGYQHETTHTDTVTQTVQPMSRVQIYAYATGTTYGGYQLRYPAGMGMFCSPTFGARNADMSGEMTGPAVNSSICGQRSFTAFRSEGVGFRLL